MEKKLISKEEMSQKGLELVAYAGEARSYYMAALKAAKDKDFNRAEELKTAANKSLTEAHLAQTELIQNEARGNYGDVSMIMVHGQDHLMTTILIRDLIDNLIDIYKSKKWSKR